MFDSYLDTWHEAQERVRFKGARGSWPYLHVPLFDVYQFSLLVSLAPVRTVLQGAVERLVGASRAQQRRVRVLAEGLRLVHLVAGLRTILELEDDQDDQNYGDQRRGYDADYQGGVFRRLGRYPLVIVVLRGRRHRRVDGGRRGRRWVRHLRGGALGRHGRRSLRHDAAARFEIGGLNIIEWGG